MEVNKLIDVFGKAIKDYYLGTNAVIETFSSIGGWDELPVNYLYRTFDKMPNIEQTALKMASGTVLDLGCGAGSHSLYLQKEGHSVKSIDISKGAIEVCKLRGLKNAEVLNLWDLNNDKFDSILSLMNGAGICGSVDKIPDFLNHLVSLLNPGGQILIDSSDIIYMFEDENGEVNLSETDHYYGEVTFESRYKGETSGRYPWLYIDFYNLQQQAFNLNLKCELVTKGSHYDYLAKITCQD